MTVATARRESLYRYTYASLWVIGGVGLGALTYLDRPVLGVVFYAVTILSSVALRYTYNGILFDQRDSDHERIASTYTLTLFGWASAIVFPVLIVLSAFGYFSWEPWAIAVASTVAALYIAYAVSLVIVVRRY